MKRSRAGVLGLLILVGAQQTLAFDAGVALLEVQDPVFARRAPALVFYPTTEPAAQSRFGEYHAAARLDAVVASGNFPLIVLSHGHGGSRFAHHDLSAALARAGFVVAAIDHLGDNVEEAAEALRASVLVARPKQLSSLLDAVLDDDRFSAAIDPSRVGVAGFSAGAYTALAVAGAVPNAQQWTRYCATAKRTAALCPPPADIGVLAPGRSLADARVRAVYLMAPLAVIFDRRGLENVSVPVRVVAGGRDRLLPLDANVSPLRRYLPRRPKPWIIKEAAHFTFLAPCSASLRAKVPAICEDAAGVDRTAIHEKIAADAIRFFRQNLPAR